MCTAALDTTALDNSNVPEMLNESPTKVAETSPVALVGTGGMTLPPDR